MEDEIRDPDLLSAEHVLKRVRNGVTIVLNVGVTTITLLVAVRVSPLDQSR